MDVIVGRRSVLELLRGERPVSRVVLAKGLKPNEAIKEIESLAAAKQVPVTRVDRREIDGLAEEQAHQGVAALVEPYRFADFSAVLRATAEATDGLLVALDGITDPHNAGALIRTADAVGVTAVLLPKRRTAPISTTVFKTSAGAVEHIQIARVGNLATAIDEAKEAGFWVYGATVSAESTLFEQDFSGKVLIVLGSEGEGLSRLIKEKCDFLVRIPMAGKISSLNVSVAGALLMYEVYRKIWRS
ncbi:MAG: 23S rRNA (guanosine(2251)-2'-O)-methyltransferase RlmB [Chloroflexi bacterium]|nr:23S rRNA (guanosine(2251)-2'-O)-methyltransferase RlmB [Chloroflexota bacterium]